MAITDTTVPVGARALAALDAGRRARPGPVAHLVARLAAWLARRRDAALSRRQARALRALSREAARDVGLADWPSRRSAAARGAVPPPTLW